MPPILSDDIILLVAQHLQTIKSHKTLSNLSLTSKTNYQLLTPIVYRHLILTDYSLPLFFSRITDIPQDEKHTFFQPIKEEEEENILPSILNPIRRIRIQLSMIYKITVDTNYEEFDFELLTSLAKCLNQFFNGDILMPNVSRLIFTSKHGTSRRIGLFSSDCRPYLLRNFLPLACNPKYICCSFSDKTPACLGDSLLPLFNLKDDRKEIINIHQARRIIPPSGLTTSRISFGKPRCFYGDDCTDIDHPNACENDIIQDRIKELILGAPNDISSIMQNITTAQPQKPNKQNLKIIERDNPEDHMEKPSYYELFQKYLNVMRDNPIPPQLLNLMQNLPQGLPMNFGQQGATFIPLGPGGFPPPPPAPGNGHNIPNVNIPGNGDHGGNGHNGNGSNGGGNGNAGTNIHGNGNPIGNGAPNYGGTAGTLPPGFPLLPGGFGPGITVSTMGITVNHGQNANNTNTNNNNANNTTPANNVNSYPVNTGGPSTNSNTPPNHGNPATNTGLNGMMGSLGSLFRSTFFSNNNNNNNTNNTNSNGTGNGSTTNVFTINGASTANPTTHPFANPFAQPSSSSHAQSTGQPKEDLVHPDIVFVLGEDADNEPVCEACGEPI